MSNLDLSETAVRNEFLPKLARRAFLSLLFAIAWMIMMITMYILPTEAANKITSSVQNLIDIFVKDEAPAPTQISAYLTDYAYAYFGEEQEIILRTVPSDADNGFTLSSDSPYIELTEKGFRVLTTKWVSADITVTSTANPSIQYVMRVPLTGINPSDKQNERLLSFNGDEVAADGDISLDLFKQYKITPIFKLSDEAAGSVMEGEAADGYSTYGKCRIFWNGSEDNLPFHVDLNYKTVTFTKECDGVLTVAFLKSGGTERYDADSTVSVNISARSSGNDYTLTSPPELYSGDINIERIDEFNCSVLWSIEKSNGAYIYVRPQGNKNTSFNIIPVGDALDYVSIYGSSIFLKRSYGSFSLDIVPILDESKTVRLNVTIDESVPRSIKIKNYDRVAMSGLTVDNTVSVHFDSDTNAYNNEIKWSIVSGGQYARIDEDTGVIQPIFPGSIRVRAESEYYGLSDEADIEVKLYATAAGFVKKIIGHFMLYLVLGYAVYVFLRYVMPSGFSASLTAIGFTLIFALSTEGLQMLTDERGARPFDMMLNSSGALIGIITAALIIKISTVVLSLKDRETALIRQKCIKEFTFEDLLLYRRKDF